MQSCQPLCFGHSLPCPSALHYAATHYASPQHTPDFFDFFFFSILCVHLGIKCSSNWLQVCPFRVCEVGYATANQQSCFNKLTNRSVWFNSRSYASLPDETTSVFMHFKSPCRSEKLKASSLVINCTPNFPGRI